MIGFVDRNFWFVLALIHAAASGASVGILDWLSGAFYGLLAAICLWIDAESRHD